MEFEVVRAKEKSNKRPILFLHGWGGNKDSFAFLSSYFTDRDLYFVSFAGHGNTPEPKLPMGVCGFAKEVEEFVIKNKIEGCNLVAHSFGGRVALLLLATKQKLFSCVVLTGCAGLHPKRSFKLRCKILWFKVKKWAVRLGLAPYRILENAGSEDYRQLSPVMRECFKMVIKQDLGPYAKKVKAECLLVWGENDTATPLEMGKRLKKYIKNSELVVLSGSDHFCFYQQPLRFALILRYFFVS